MGRKRIEEAKIQAVVVNNKVRRKLCVTCPGSGVDDRSIDSHQRVTRTQISNVCPGGGGGDGGVGDAEKVCDAVAKSMGFASGSFVLPSSTGVIGWRLPVQAIVDVVVRGQREMHEPATISDFSALPSDHHQRTHPLIHSFIHSFIHPFIHSSIQPKVLETLQSKSIMPAAAGIITTDRYPKVRAAKVAGGRIVGIAKGAGMIEPNLATMLVYILTDLAVPRDVLRSWLPEVVGGSFNCISVDSDQSTSDTVALISSGKVPVAEADYPRAKAALAEIARSLAEDVVRNGEGTNHVIEVTVSNAPSLALARALGRHVVNSPLLKCAVAGNDPNVGRLAAAVGSYIGNNDVGISLEQCRLLMGGKVVFKGGAFDLNPEKEAFLVEHMKSAQLEPGPLTMESGAHVTFPPHERSVKVEVDLGQPNGVSLTLYGSDLTYAYVMENADYRS